MNESAVNKVRSFGSLDRPAPKLGETHGSTTGTNSMGIGAPLSRIEDIRLVTGNGRYATNFSVPGQLYGYVLRSPLGHARIRGIDVSAALDVPGLVAVLTGEDYFADGIGNIPCVSIPPTIKGGTHVATPFPALARDVVRCVGAEVAFVVAETQAAAVEAAERIVVDYEPLPVAATLEAAIAPDAPLVWPSASGNRCFYHELGNEDACDAAFSEATHIVRARIRNQRVAGNPLEPRNCVGRYDPADGRFHLTSSTANPHRLRLLLSEHIFQIPAHRIHVVAGDVGGGFGTKGGLYPEEVLVLWAAWRLGRPVKWVCERSEAFLSDFNGRDQIADAEMALDEDGRVLGFRVEVYHNLGSALGPSTAHPPLVGTRMLSGVYSFPALHVKINGIFTNSRTLTTYRGAGRPEATLIVEQMMELAAQKIGLDPVEIRRRNFIKPEQMPYKTAIGETYDCGEFEAAMDSVLELADWDGFAARRAESEARGMFRGRGLSCYIEVCATLSDRMEVRFDSSGGLSILAGTFSYGQGHETTYAQMVHDWLGVPIEKIRFIQGDTDIIATGRGSFGSRSMTVGGSALRKACDNVVAMGRGLAALMLDVDGDELDFNDGAYIWPSGDQRRVSLVEVAKASFAWKGTVAYNGGPPKPIPAELWSGLEGIGHFSADPQNYPNGCYAAEVEVDPETGVVRIDRIAGIDDVGTVINPLLLEGQVIGGCAQAVGQVLLEAIIHDAEGQVLSGAFTDYGMPRAEDFPRMALTNRPVPTATNPLGVKGGAETGTIGLPPAIVSAVLDALRPLGVTQLSMPLTPMKVWSAINAASQTKALKETA